MNKFIYWLHPSPNSTPHHTTPSNRELLCFLSTMEFSPSNPPPPPPPPLQNYSQLLQNLLGFYSPNAVGATEILHDRRRGEERRQQSTAEQRKQRRMVSNRESARRARVRRQQQLCELRAQVAHLRSANRRFLGELNRVMREREEVRHENAWMKEEETELRSKLAGLEEQLSPIIFNID